MNVVTSEISDNSLTPAIFSKSFTIDRLLEQMGPLSLKRKVGFLESTMSSLTKDERESGKKESLHRMLCPNPKDWANTGFSKAFKLCNSLINANRHIEAAEILPLIVKNNQVTEDLVAGIVSRIAEDGFISEACHAWSQVCRYYPKKAVDGLIGRFAQTYLNKDQRDEFHNEIIKNAAQEIKIEGGNFPLERKVLIGIELLARNEFNTLIALVDSHVSGKDLEPFLVGLSEEIADAGIRKNLFRFICRPEMQPLIPPGYLKFFFAAKSGNVYNEAPAYSEILKEGSLQIPARDAKACFDKFSVRAFSLCADIMEVFFLREESASLAKKYAHFLTTDYPIKDSPARISKFLTLRPAYAPLVAQEVLKQEGLQGQKARFHLWRGLNAANPQLTQACLWKVVSERRHEHIVRPLFGALLPKGDCTVVTSNDIQALKLLAEVVKSYPGTIKDGFFRSISALNKRGLLKDADMQTIAKHFKSPSLGEMKSLYTKELLSL